MCVESILAQSHPGFELVILENQSTDGTAEWLQNIEKKDSRVRVVPSEHSLSIEDNWKRILHIPKNKYMTIIGHDDLLESNFLEEINNLIRSEPEASLYLTHFKLIDSEGRLIRHCMPIPKYETAAEFLAARMSEIRDSFGTGYVMKSDCYDQFGGIPSFSNLLYADDALWLGLMKHSFKVTSPRMCFSYRLHSGSVSGKPNPEALFNGLKQYLCLLRDMAGGDKGLALVINQYAPKYVGRHSQYYYYWLRKVTPYGNQIDVTKMLELESFLREFSPTTVLDRNYMNFSRRVCRKLMAWMAHKCA